MYHLKEAHARATLETVLAEHCAGIVVLNTSITLMPYCGWEATIFVPRGTDVVGIPNVAIKFADPKDPDRSIAPWEPVDKPTKAKRVTTASGEDVFVAPTKGATRRVWEIADETCPHGAEIDRAAIIEACVAQGINASTAGTQFSKWKKARLASD